MNYQINSHADARVLIVYRNWGANSGTASHIGLGVNGLHTSRVLRDNGIVCDITAVWKYEHVYAALSKTNYTHCVIDAAFLGIYEMQRLLYDFPSTHFTVRCHSQIGFLQVEAGAVKLFREIMALQESMLNLSLSANNIRFCKFVEEEYNTRCICLPNLYHMNRVSRKRFRPFSDGDIRISSFGAIRLMKNHATAAAAAMMIATRVGADLEFHLSTERVENGRGVLEAIRNMFAGLPTAKLVEVPWKPWPEFCKHVGAMDLTLQVSTSETFNIVTADSIAAGVPSVVSSAIDWAPKGWMANVDDADDIARVGVGLLYDPTAAEDGLLHLKRHQAAAINDWKRYLSNDSPCSAREA